MKPFVTVSSGLDYLPLFARQFIHEKRLPNPYLIPVRRNCLSGSGKKNECHANSYALAKRFGGEPINGYSITIRTKHSQLQSVFFTDHTVWKTPENRLVDVTAHNFSNTDLAIFAPVSSLLDKKSIFPSVNITPDYLKTGVSADFRFLELNAIVSKIIKVKETYVSPSKSILLIPASLMSPHLFTIPWEKPTESELLDLYKSAEFLLPSTATGRYWTDISDANDTKNHC